MLYHCFEIREKKTISRVNVKYILIKLLHIATSNDISGIAPHSLLEICGEKNYIEFESQRVFEVSSTSSPKITMQVFLVFSRPARLRRPGRQRVRHDHGGAVHDKREARPRR